MNKPIKLYDFSTFNAIVVVLAYLCLMAIFAGTAAGASNPIPHLVIIVVLVISFVALFWHFVGKALTLDENGAHRGKKTLAKQGLQCTVFYNTRYRELSIRFQRKEHVLTVQATKRNIAKTQAWLGHTLEIPEKNSKFGQ